MASSCSSNDNRNFQCVAVASVDLIKLILRDILASHIKPADLFQEVKSCLTLNLRQEQLKICLVQPPDYNSFDVSLLYTLIRNLCPLPSPAQGWGKEPKASDILLSDDIERLRLFRNNYYAHAESSEISESVFKDIWRNLRLAINRIQSRCNVNYEDELIRIEQSKYTLSHWKECMVLLNAYASKQNQTDGRDEPDISIQGENEIHFGGTAQFEADVKKVESSYWTIKWQKRIGDVIKCIDTSAKRYSGSTKKKLVIKFVNKEDEGEYQAVLSLESNGPDYKSRNTICLHVIGDIPCVKILVDSPVRFGSETIIKSVISSTPTPEKIEWQTSTDGIHFYCIRKPSCFDRLKLFKSPSLVIPETTFYDKLYYRLLVSNGIGESVSNKLFLNVTGSLPNITTSLETNIKMKSVKLIGNIYFYDDSPGILDTYWTKNDEKINLKGSSEKLSEMSSDIPSLTIKNVSPGDAGKYQLTATNAVGSSTSDVIVLGSPSVFVEKIEDENNGGQRISVMIKSYPAPCLVQWRAKCQDGDNFAPIDINAEEYKGTTVSFPHSVLVVRQSDHFEKKCFRIEVTNFIGKTLQEIFGDNNPVVPTNTDIVENTVYKDRGASLRFTKLSSILVNQFPPDKVEHLKFLLISSNKVKNQKSVSKATSALDCLKILQDEKLFTQRDVIFMQFLCSELNFADLYAKCVEYAEKQKALCYFEKRSVNGYKDVQFHVQGDVSDYTKDYIQDVIQTVAVILDCRVEDILLNGVRHSTSFLLFLSVMNVYIVKLLALKERERLKLRRLNIDYLIIGNETIRLDEQKDHLARGHLTVQDTSPIMSFNTNALDPICKTEMKETKVYRPGLRKMENLWKIFQENGYSFKEYSADCYSFYYCLMEEMDRKPLAQIKAREIQSELFEFQKKNSIYYHLFLSQCVTCDGVLSSNDFLQLEFEKIKDTKKPPTPREVFAAAEMLHRYICVIRYDRSVGRDIKKLKGYIFAPTSKDNLNMGPLCLLMLEKADGVVEFCRIGRKDEIKDLNFCPCEMVNMDHKHCFGLRFVNDFSVLFDRKFAYGQKSDVKDLFRLLSLELYGTENHHSRILNIICNFELEEDNLELFCKYADNTITEETSLDDKRKRLNTHVKNVRSRMKPAGEGELFAVSSVYNVDLIIDVTGRDEWETYMSVVCCYLSCFDSPIILRVQGRDDKLYMPYVTESNTCSCQQKPQIQGHIGKVKGNIHEAVLKHPCCAPEIRKGNHTHLKHVPNIRSCWPPQKDYIIPAEFMTMVISRLEIEDRRIDQINGGEGSLAKAMAKELYGNENDYLASGLQDAMGREDLDYDVKLGRLSSWLKVPIYIYMNQKKVDDGHAQFNASQRFLWAKFEPDLSMTIVSSDCRFYITLFYNHLNGTFDRIIPLRGCNCQNPAPLSLLRNSQNMETQFLPCVYPDDRHHPLPTFLTTDPDRNNFDMEIRDFPACSAYSSVRIAMQRNDMGKRTIDCVEINQHSLLRCLSKEIFGTEKNVDLLIEELCNEFSNNVESYIHFVGEKIIKAYEESGGKIQNNRSSNEKLAKFVKERIEDDLPCDELLLWLACTFFQTTIFVLRVTDTKTSTESFWTEYAMVRRRRKDPTRRTSFSRRCSKEKTYYITLFESGSKLYHRIVPKQASCNCALDAPTVPDHNADATEYHTFQDCKLMRKIRKIDSLLNTACTLVDQWLICNQILQRNCELIVLEIEGRRKNVNIATIAGTGTGIVGAVLTGVGIFLAPATGGLSTLLSVGGAVMAVSGGTVATGAKITESVLNNSTIDKLKRYQNCYKERFDSLKSVIKEINNEMKELSELSKEIQANQNIESSDFADIQSIPGIVRAVKGLIMIPISLLKVSARGITILGAIIGPLSALIDAALLVFSAKNMAEGNKTDVTENLRRISAALYGSRRQMHSWAYGNQRPYHYD